MTGDEHVRFYRIRNWERFQHYKDRRPSWIKLHLSLLHDPDFFGLSDCLKVQLVSLWIYAGKNDEMIPIPQRGHDRYLERYNLSERKFDLDALLDAGFLEVVEEKTPAIADDSGLLAGCYQTASPRARPRSVSKDLDLKPKSTENAAVAEVYDTWRVELGKTDPRFAKRITPNRRAKITARLREGYTVADLKTAIRGVTRDPWPDRPRHNDITTIFRSAEQVDKFLELAGDVSVLSPEERRQRHLESLRSREVA